MPTINQIRNEKEMIQRLRVDIETIQNQLKSVNDSYMTYQKVIANQEQFSKQEFEELCSLFQGKTYKLIAY